MENIGPFLIPIGVVAILFAAFFARRWQLKKRTAVIQQFAASNSMQFVPREQPATPEVVSLPKITARSSYSDVVSGVVQGFPVRIFTHRYKIGSGRSRREVFAAVGAVELPHAMPHLVIDSLMAGEHLATEFNRSQRLELEGDFNEHFAVYAADKRELDALIVLAPDIMLRFLQLGATCDVEFIDKKMYVSKSHTSVDAKAYAEVLKTINVLLAELAGKLQRFDTAAASAPVATTGEKAPAPASRLKKTRLSSIITTALACIIIAAIFALYLSGLAIPDWVIPALYAAIIGVFLLFIARGLLHSRGKQSLEDRYGTIPDEPSQSDQNGKIPQS